jgi:hypothetical protein
VVGREDGDPPTRATIDPTRPPKVRTTSRAGSDPVAHMLATRVGTTRAAAPARASALGHQSDTVIIAAAPAATTAIQRRSASSVGTHTSSTRAVTTRYSPAAASTAPLTTAR